MALIESGGELRIVEEFEKFQSTFFVLSSQSDDENVKPLSLEFNINDLELMPGKQLDTFLLSKKLPTF
jgi:phage tail sheath gpL-like